MSTGRVMSERMVIEVDGVRVEGEVERSFRHIFLRMVSPYHGLTAGLNIALFLPRPPAPDFSGPAGETCAAQMLRELYRVGKFVDENKESLREKVKEFDATIARIDHEQYPTEDDFREFRRGLRAQLRAGSHRQPILRAATPCGAEEGGGEGCEDLANRVPVLQDEFPDARASAGRTGDPAVAGVKVPGG